MAGLRYLATGLIHASGRTAIVPTLRWVGGLDRDAGLGRDEHLSQQLRMDDEPDQYVVAYTARPGTADEEALRFLSAWTASPKESRTAESDSLS